MENAQIVAENSLEFLKSGDADGLRRALEQDPAAAETRDATGVSLLMHCLYRGRRDLADLVASKKKSLDIFEATSLGNLERLKQCLREDASAALRNPSTHAPATDSLPCISPASSDSPPRRVSSSTTEQPSMSSPRTE